MPTYVFERNDDGATVEKFFPMGDAPRICDEIVIDGHMCTRVASSLMVDAGVKRKVHQYPFNSESLPRHVDLGCERDDKGRQIVPNQRAEKSILDAASGYSRSIGEGDWARD